MTTALNKGRERVMIKFTISLLVFLISVSAAWAGDEAPTAISNKEAIDLVQTHANYLWTLIAAALVFFYAGRICHGRGWIHPG
jgi:hypothetical protein